MRDPVSGRARIFARSVPVRQAAVDRRMPPAVPVVTRPASVPVRRATSPQAHSISSSMTTKERAASVIFCNTSGAISEPPR